MISKIILDTVKKISIEEVLAYYEIEIPRSQFITCIRPEHEDSSPSMKVYPETSTAFCFGCRHVFDVIEIVKIMEKKQFEEAVMFLYSRFKATGLGVEKNAQEIDLYNRLNKELKSVFNMVQFDKEKRMKAVKILQIIDLNAEDNLLILKLYQRLLTLAEAKGE